MWHLILRIEGVKMPNKIENAYKLSQNIYDDALTQKKWWAKLYNYVFWGGVDNLEISKKILSIIPKDFSGVLFAGVR